MSEQMTLPLEEPEHQMHPSIVRSYFSLLTEEEVAAALGVTADTLAKWRARGAGPDFTKPGKRVFYRVEDVRAWLATRRQSPSEPEMPFFKEP